MPNHDDHKPQLTAKQIAYSKAPALLTLATLRNDATEMKMHIEYLREHLTEWEIIEALVTDLSGLALATHGQDMGKLETALQITLSRITSSAIQ